MLMKVNEWSIISLSSSFFFLNENMCDEQCVHSDVSVSTLAANSLSGSHCRNGRQTGRQAHTGTDKYTDKKFRQKADRHEICLAVLLTDLHADRQSHYPVECRAFQVTLPLCLLLPLFICHANSFSVALIWLSCKVRGFFFFNVSQWAPTMPKIHI